VARVYLHVCLLNFEMARLNNTKRCDSREADEVIDFRRWHIIMLWKRTNQFFTYLLFIYYWKNILCIIYATYFYILIFIYKIYLFIYLFKFIYFYFSIFLESSFFKNINSSIFTTVFYKIVSHITHRLNYYWNDSSCFIQVKFVS